MTDYEVTITMILEFEEETTVDEVRSGAEAAMWGNRVTIQDGARLVDLHFEAKEKKK